jgi:hypothetical protein
MTFSSGIPTLSSMPVAGINPLAYRFQSLVGTPLTEAAAIGSSNLDVAQRSVTIGEMVPIVFGRRRGAIGGVLISPGATEARFENSLTNEVTASYHLVLSEGELPGVEVRDVFQRSCRVGSFTQTYNRRAGSWLPGNFIIDRGGSYTKPEASYYCGTGGTYEDMTTGSYVIEDVPNGDTRWDRQVHLFCRGGMQLTRLRDGVYGPSDNLADLALYLVRKTSRVPESLIDVRSFRTAAVFTDNLGLWFNGVLDSSANLEDFLAQFGGDFLLMKTKRGGKIGMRSLLPSTSAGLIDIEPIVPVYRFTENHIIPGSFAIDYVPLGDRKPFVALMTWRQQPTDDIGIIRTTEVRYAGTAIDGPYEQHDVSLFCTSENHAVKAGTYKVSKRRHVSHTLQVRVRPGSYNTTLSQGDIVQVRLQRVTPSAPPGEHNFLYEVDRIGKARTGELTLDLTHFPVDDQGRSLVALDVAAAIGGGVLLDTGKSGTSCDVNADDDDTVPADDSLDAGDWIRPGDDAFGVDGGDPAEGGGGGAGDGGAGGGFDADGNPEPGGGFNADGTPVPGGSGPGGFDANGDPATGGGFDANGDPVPAGGDRPDGAGGGFDADGNPEVGGGFNADGTPVPAGGGPGGFDEFGDPLEGGGFDANGVPVPAGGGESGGFDAAGNPEPGGGFNADGTPAPGFTGLPDPGFGTGAGSDGGFGGGGGGGSGEGGENPGEELDPQSGVTGISPGGPVPGDDVAWEGCGCTDSTIEWYVDGVLVGTSGTYRITVADMGKNLVGVGKCNGINTCETDPIPVPFTPEAYTYWRFVSDGGAVSGWFNQSSSYGGWSGSSSVSPGGLIPWFAGGGTIIVVPPGTSTGGFLGGVYAFSRTTNGIIGAFTGYVGAATIDTPYDMGGGGKWQFSNSNTDTGPDAWEGEWKGEPNPNSTGP